MQNDGLNEILINLATSFNKGQVGSKTRALGQIIE